MADKMPPTVANTPTVAREEISRRMPASVRIVMNLLAVIVPFLGFITAIVLTWGWGINATHLGICAALYFLTALGITVGYHRLFAHRAFETHAAVQWIFGVLGSMAVEGPLRKWVATHRRHHQHADEDGDPHSPHLHGEGFIRMLRGLWHAHTGWLFAPETPGLSRYVPDLIGDRVASQISRLFPVLVLMSLLLPAMLGGLLTMSWQGAVLSFFWGGLARIFLVHHMTWSINSICHLWGTRPFNTHDESRNSFVFGVLSLGEGWHNNHHAFPTSARHGLRWWEIDVSYYVISALKVVGLAWDVRLPGQEKITMKRAL